MIAFKKCINITEQKTKIHSSNKGSVNNGSKHSLKIFVIYTIFHNNILFFFRQNGQVREKQKRVCLRFASLNAGVVSSKLYVLINCSKRRVDTLGHAMLICSQGFAFIAFGKLNFRQIIGEAWEFGCLWTARPRVVVFGVESFFWKFFFSFPLKSFCRHGK